MRQKVRLLGRGVGESWPAPLLREVHAAEDGNPRKLGLPLPFICWKGEILTLCRASLRPQWPTGYRPTGLQAEKLGKETLSPA